MSPRPCPHKPTAPLALDDLPRVAVEALRLLRLWVWAPSSRDVLRLAVPTRFGPRRAGCILSGLAGLAARLEGAGPGAAGVAGAAATRCEIRPPDSARVSAGEAGLAGLLVDAAAGDMARAEATAIALLGPADGPEAAQAARIMAQRIAEAEADRASAACPTACPARWSCTDRPVLRAVE